MKLLKQNSTIVVIIISVLISVGFLVTVIKISKTSNQKTPEEIRYEEEYENEVQATSLEGMVEEFELEASVHVEPGTKDIVYKTNPPTSGTHWTEAEIWGISEDEVPDGKAVHSIEHGGIWISYKPDKIDRETLTILEELQKENRRSVVLSPRADNDSAIVVASWGRMMKLEEASFKKSIVQKYIDTYINDSPEKLAT